MVGFGFRFEIAKSELSTRFGFKKIALAHLSRSLTLDLPVSASISASALAKTRSALFRAGFCQIGSRSVAASHRANNSWLVLNERPGGTDPKRAAGMDFGVPESVQNVKDFLFAHASILLCDALSCKSKSLPERAIPNPSTLIGWYNKRGTSKFKRETALRLQAARDNSRPSLPIPAPVAESLSCGVTESLIDYLARLNERIPSLYRFHKALQALDQLAEQKTAAGGSSRSTLQEDALDSDADSSFSSAVKPAFANLSLERRIDYAGDMTSFLARQRSVEGGLRSLHDSVALLLTPSAAEEAQAGILSATSARRNMHIFDVWYAEKADQLLAGRMLAFGADTGKVGKRNLMVMSVSAFLRESNVIFREVFAIEQLPEGTGAEYDVAKARAFSKRQLDEHAVCVFLLDGASTNQGVHKGLVTLSNRRLDTPLAIAPPCFEHCTDLALHHATTKLCGSDTSRCVSELDCPSTYSLHIATLD